VQGWNTVEIDELFLCGSMERGRDRERKEAAGLVILNKRVVGLSEVSLSRFVLRTRRALGLKGTVNVMVTSSAAMRNLNLRFRQKNKPTDVLSFPAAAANGKPRFAGEIAISADIALQNAFQLGHSPAAEIKVLALHGMLHLAGFDHERDNGAMSRKETLLRRQLRLPSTLIEREQFRLKRSAATHRQRKNAIARRQA
jgi:probable rRNA maturation factor